MTVDIELENRVRQLRRVGLRPPEQLANAIVKAGEAARAPLIELAVDRDALNAPPPASYGPLHALRLLGELHTTAIIEPLLDNYPMDYGGNDEEGRPVASWDQELPQIIGKLGAAAVDTLWNYIDNPEKMLLPRSAALTSLAYVTAADPALRDDIVAGLRTRIGEFDDQLAASYALIALANIGAPEAYAEVMALYRAKHFDTELIPAGTARQLLLSKSDLRLSCVKHPLWERYDQHGPFDPASRQ